VTPHARWQATKCPVAILLQFPERLSRQRDSAIGQAGVKMTALRRVHRARHVALQADPLALHFGVRHRHGGEQGPGYRDAADCGRGRLALASSTMRAEIHHPLPRSEICSTTERSWATNR